MDTDDKRKPADPTVILQPPTVIQPVPRDIQEILAKVKKQLASEDFRDAQATLNALLQSHPNLEPAIVMQEEIQNSASRYIQNILDQGIQHYADCDWDRAVSIWKKALDVDPNGSTAKEWIHKAEVKKEQEKIVRAGLLRELEKCGKSLSTRNFVLAEEQLDELKDRFTGAYRLTDLQRIYEALVVRTRIALEREFEDLRDNVIENPEVAIPVPTREEPKSQVGAPLKEYMSAFDSGKKFFDKEDWENALKMWNKARSINPADGNLIHWIALAQSHLEQQTAPKKQSPVRSTFAFLSVFFVTALLVYIGYNKYTSYVRVTKNHELFQRAMEHYRAGHLEESWKTLQLYVLQDPDNESARELLEKLTFEMRVRQTIQNQQNEINLLRQAADQQKTAQSHKQMNDAEQKIAEAQEVQKQTDAEQLQTERISSQIEAAKFLIDRGQKDAAAMILRRILDSNPSESQAKQLLAKMRNTPVAPVFAVEIHIQPAAHLFVDGHDAGTRDEFQLLETSGRHFLHIERLGYHNIDQAVEIKTGEKNVFTFQLKSL